MDVSYNAPGGAVSVHMAALSADAREFSRVLYHVLVSTVQGKGPAVIRGGERANGLQCWVMLCEELEPKSGSRLTALLCGLMAPPWTVLEGPAFLRALAAWEVEACRYESQGREYISDGIKGGTRVVITTLDAPVPGTKLAIRGLENTAEGTTGERSDQ